MARRHATAVTWAPRSACSLCNSRLKTDTSVAGMSASSLRGDLLWLKVGARRRGASPGRPVRPFRIAKWAARSGCEKEFRVVRGDQGTWGVSAPVQDGTLPLTL